MKWLKVRCTTCHGTAEHREHVADATTRSGYRTAVTPCPDCVDGAVAERMPAKSKIPSVAVATVLLDAYPSSNYDTLNLMLCAAPRYSYETEHGYGQTRCSFSYQRSLLRGTVEDLRYERRPDPRFDVGECTWSRAYAERMHGDDSNGFPADASNVLREAARLIDQIDKAKARLLASNCPLAMMIDALALLGVPTLIRWRLSANRLISAEQMAEEIRAGRVPVGRAAAMVAAYKATEAAAEAARSTDG